MIPLKDNVLLSGRFAYVTAGLIVINVLVFIAELIDLNRGGDGLLRYALTSHTISLTTLLTYQFLHGGWLHIIGNMVYLWVFGIRVEDYLGHIPFLVSYLVLGILGGLAQAILLNSDAPLIGASAAVAGILGIYTVWFARAQIRVLLPIIIFWTVITLPATVVLGLWFITNLFNSFAAIGSTDLSGVAYVAHITGFVGGAIIAYAFAARRRTVAYLRQ